ncbi:TetR family transcriptional regulator [Gordonia sp. HY002]|uniref:TetR family transcriptional regulator n=1 Tax=Gordonia zhenghanii TaxID=2911516 RepID=UPI001EF0AAA8|nr:TetR family transcriptional regulator [Gordonia zhenghanii]MCF8572106.1 TetR family transcriptional regulator [Gordonia zhenghanii]MCF8602980.1 TetR family transcriptional regulator [Gordonia zhenghanii]
MSLSTGRTALLDSAEKLIAARGVYGVSAREVVRGAGHRNSSAIAYHFGSWHGLLDAIWARRSPPINAERAALIAAIDQPDITQLVHAYIRPLTNQVTTHSPSHWARFNEQWLASVPLDVLGGPAPDGDHSYYPLDDSLDVVSTLLYRIALTLDLPEVGARRRVGLVVRFVFNAYAAWERDRENGTAPEPEEFESEVEHMACAMLGTGI